MHAAAAGSAPEDEEEEEEEEEEDIAGYRCDPQCGSEISKPQAEGRGERPPA